MNFLIVQNECRRCMGTGTSQTVLKTGETTTEDPCPQCNGAGFNTIGRITGDDLDKILRRLKKIMDALSVVED